MSLLSRLAVQAARAYGILSSADKNKVAASYLVVAGGGGGAGGTAGGGGGGAGGYQTSTFTLSTLNTYSIAVGAGGNGGAINTIGSQGSSSVISGTGLTTVTSVGGGYGGYNNVAAGSGGSGGGGGGRSTTNRFGGSATSGQGNAGGDGLNDATNQSGAGGGGAGAVGGNASGSSTGGAGGNGLSSSISGSSVTYAGGGGGAGFFNTAYGTTSNGGLGGTGGGGTANSPGTANLGGGGGGGGGSAGGGGAGAGAAGGSGIVIISYTSATPKFVGGTLTTSGGNQIHTFTSSGTLSPITPVTASYLVVAGGGGGGRQYGGQGAAGGGGAGGLLTSSTTLYSGATYVVTVGAGGAGGSSAGAAPSGSDSSISGTGLTTVTSTGGGGGAGSSGSGASGGSGGGGQGETAPKTGGAGTSGQGFAGGTGAAAGGGGGGASAVGANAATNVSGGNGGAGTASSISGTSVTYAGGGGGGGYTSTAGTGGAGGGGTGQTGQSSTALAVSGTTNLGGGGGGAGYVATGNYNGAAGGSGVVIISYAGSQVFNGGLVTSSGGNTIHTFTATGALTPLTNNLNNSLRFRASATAHLSRNSTVTGNRKTWTWSGWVKRSTLATNQGIYYAYKDNNNADGMSFQGDALELSAYLGGATYQIQLATTQVFRDPSAWYHLVFVVDTTQATAANRAKIYVNGIQVTAFSTATYPAQNTELTINSICQNTVGATNYSTIGSPFDGYMTDINFIDGQALEPYYFGNNDANGVWKPIKYTGTYGTNGFYLTFGNTTSTTTLGYDSSPNGNNWTTNNISLTAGTTYDAMTDVPTNTSATVANYCVLNPLVASTTATITGANLNATGSTTTFANARATFTLSSGKWYWEQTITGSSTLDIGIGLCTEASQKSSATNIRQTGWYNVINGAPGDVGSSANGGANINISTTNWATNDVIMVAYDADTGYIWFGRNGTWYPPTTGGSAGNPAAGTNQTISAVSNLIPASWHYNTTAGTAVNFGQRPFSYTPPTGFTAVNTFNLSTPTILQGNKYMDATLWSGDSTSPRVITNQAQFKPDLVWVKGRNGTINHILIDSVRGTGKNLISNSTSAEVTSPVNGSVGAFNANGFNVVTGTSDTVEVNYTGYNYVGWQWQAGQGSTSSNTQGSTTSTVSVNTTAGFSIVTYTGTGSAATVGHGLGVAPKMIIVKGRNTTIEWLVYHASLGATQYITLNTTGAAASAASAWNNTSPTSSVFSVLSAGSTNFSGTNYVAYCWAEITGFSKFGSYTGNASTDGPFVYLGFRPEWIMIKGSSAGGNPWYIVDATRNTYNVAGQLLEADSSVGESTYSFIDFLSNGFKIRNTGSGINGLGTTFIYAAFAENPFKNANAR